MEGVTFVDSDAEDAIDDFISEMDSDIRRSSTEIIDSLRRRRKAVAESRATTKEAVPSKEGRDRLGRSGRRPGTTAQPRQQTEKDAMFWREGLGRVVDPAYEVSLRKAGDGRRTACSAERRHHAEYLAERTKDEKQTLKNQDSTNAPISYNPTEEQLLESILREFGGT